MRLFGGDKMQMIASRAMGSETMVEAGMLSRAIENAQKRVEGRNFSIRKNVLQYDDVMNQQRELIYSQRRRVLEGEDVSESILDMTDKVIERTVHQFTADADKNEWNIGGLLEELKRICIARETEKAELEGLGRDAMIEKLQELSRVRYEKRAKELAEAGLSIKDVERFALLQSVDRHWMDHIDAMDQLRQGISLRSMAQRDPLQEFKMESYDMFEEMTRCIQEDAVRLSFNAMISVTARPKAPKITGERKAGDVPARPKKAGQVVSAPKVGRNDPCPCGSGKKYKNCCGAAK